MIEIIRIFLVSSFFVLVFTGVARPAVPERVFIIQIDSLHPGYIGLNRQATGPGQAGDWLMPNVRRFVDQSAHWPRASSSFPHSTDSNVLNILASSDAGHTGIIGVRKQLWQWGLLGLFREKIHLGRARYPDGGQVRTLFDVAKENRPDIKSALISNKGWVPVEYGSDFGIVSSVDLLVNGEHYPPYIEPPEYISFYDNPATDADAFCDPESAGQIVSFPYFEKRPHRHPRDSWVAESALRVVAQENPGLLFILLGDLDHGQHLLGTASNPDEWLAGPMPDLPAGCAPLEQYRWISRMNPSLYREPILDLVRDVDAAFGHLMNGLEAGGFLDNGAVILLSDHNMENCLSRPGGEQDTDVTQILTNAGLAAPGHFAVYNGGSIGFLFWRPLYKLFKPFVARQAREELLDARHLAFNPATGAWEMPWIVLDRQDMIQGRPELGIGPREVYNEYFVRNGVWPDLILVMNKGWQLHTYSIKADGEEVQLMKANHGGPSTSAVTLAIKGLGLPPAVLCGGEAELMDIAPAIAAQMGWAFPEALGAPLVCAPP